MDLWGEFRGRKEGRRGLRMMESRKMILRWIREGSKRDEKREEASTVDSERDEKGIEMGVVETEGDM